eukprot:TRINITY_DN3513_c1_g1_i2.p1 TRINITY_DN3513_c1_g1~~TRINITY_DN3513_c1_g1_i2.p1  ORF type:complete len:230 (-),score=31.00 TRINITY_DN3513_c1_g1_i2:423-1112(-)
MDLERLASRTPQKHIKAHFLEACLRGDTDMCKLHRWVYDKEILAQGARVACENDCEQVVLEFLQFGVIDHKQDQKNCWLGWTLLHRTCEKGHIKTALVLIENGWSVARLNATYQTPLAVATQRTRMSINLRLLERKVLCVYRARESEGSLFSCLPREILFLVLQFPLDDPQSFGQTKQTRKKQTTTPPRTTSTKRRLLEREKNSLFHHHKKPNIYDSFPLPDFACPLGF